MKYYLQKIVVGFLFGVGLFGSFLLMDEIRSGIKEKERVKLEASENDKRIASRTLDPSKVFVSNIRLVTLARNISVAVKIENDLDEPFMSAALVIKFFDDSGLFGQCREYLTGFRAKETKELVVQCEKYLSVTFPQNVKVKTEIQNVHKGSFGL